VKNRPTKLVAAVIACAGLTGSLYAQDSVSNLGASLPGDGLSPWAPTFQKVAYVVDLTPFDTSWGTRFGIAPVIKSSRTNANFTGSLVSAQFLSNDMIVNVPYTSEQYYLWENAPGSGVNPETNAPTQTIPAPGGLSNRFAAAFSEFSTITDGVNNYNYNGVIGGIINYDPAQPDRLYVTRVVAAVNTADSMSGDSAQLGFGSIDADTNTYYRADDFGLAGSPFAPSVTGNNLYRTNLNARGPVVNQINGNVATLDATQALLTGAPTAHNTPNHIPASVATAPTVATGNFSTQYVRGSAAPLTADSSHLAAGMTDHRGSLGSTMRDALGLGAVTTFGMLAQDQTGQTNTMNLWGVNANGNVLGTLALTHPSSVTDNDDGFTLAYSAAAEYRGYASQAAFRGGVGQVAIGRDRNGMALAAATMHENGLNDDFSTQILVARHNPNTGTTEWTMAAYIDQLFLSGRSGKEVYDGTGAVIGVLTPLFNVTGGTPLGPSMSAPVFDAAGNVWFIGSVELFDRLPGGGSDFDNALFRAVYDEATFSYRLELVLELGSVFVGRNSGLPWQIQFLSIADSNSIDSASMFSGNGTSHTWNNVPLANLTNDDPRTNGGIVLQASIAYDVDGDGTFDNAGGIDEEYNALLFIGCTAPEGPQPCNDADFAEPFGTLDFFDVLAFLQAFSNQDPAADINSDGLWDFFDVLAFLQAFSAGCP